jgi:hypothetical protein
VTIDGTSVKVEDLEPVQIYSNDEYVWTFGEQAWAVFPGDDQRRSY